ncbi:hypothetical protein LCGC14_1906460, partial [marine sediment metagenome]
TSVSMGNVTTNPVPHQAEQGGEWNKGGMMTEDCKYQSICFFLPTGKTFTFRNSKILTDNEQVWVVEYEAMSDGWVKTVTFFKSHVAGIAILEK